MFDINVYRNFVESKIVQVGTRKDSFKKQDILDFCCQWTKTATAYFGSSCTKKLQRVFGESIKQKPRGMSINTYLLLEFGFRRCAVCADILSLDSFCKNTSEAIGYNSKCRKCVAELRKLEAPKINELTAKRRASKFQATPKWLTKKQRSDILAFYKKAKQLETKTGVKHNVDHIIPIQSNIVCGLHVPWNLQVITAKENMSKGNRYNGI